MNHSKINSKIFLSIIFALIISISAFAGIFVSQNQALVTNTIVAEQKDEEENSVLDTEYEHDSNEEYWEDVIVENASDYTKSTIGSNTDLANFMAAVNNGKSYPSVVYLTADIDLSSKLWTPIGTSSNKFTKTFEGAGHKISGLTINKTVGSTPAGLFGYINGAKIQNVIVEGVSIDATSYTGAIVGQSYGNSTIYNCGSSGVVKSSSFMGGLVGNVNDSSSQSGTTSITNSFSVATITGSSWTGGLVGNIDYGIVSFVKCFYDGSLSYGNGGYGLIGYGKSGHVGVVDCYCNIVGNSSPQLAEVNKNQAYMEDANYWGKPTTSSPLGVNGAKIYVKNKGLNQYSGTYVLKGVGNIFVEYKIVDPTNGDNILSTAYYVRDLISEKSNNSTIDSSGIAPGTNYNFPYVEIKNSSKTEVNSSAIGNSTIQNFYNSSRDDTLTCNISNTVNDYKNTTNAILFSFGEFFINNRSNLMQYNATTVTTNAGKYVITFQKYLGASYNLTIQRRGVWRKVDLSLLQYGNATRIAQSNSGLGTAKTENAEYVQASVSLKTAYKTSVSSNAVGTKTNGQSFYIPWGEKFNITLQNNDIVIKNKNNNTTFNYLDVTGTVELSYTDASGTTKNRTGSSAYSRHSSISESYDVVKTDGSKYIYTLDNVQTITLNLNASQYSTFSKLTGLTETISSPYFTDSSSSTTVKISVKAGYKFSEFGYGGTNGTGSGAKVAKSFSDQATGYYPFWARFHCKGFSSNSSSTSSGTYWFSSPSSDTNNDKSAVYPSGAVWKNSWGTTGESTLYAQWNSIDTTMNVSLDVDGKKVTKSDKIDVWSNYLSIVESNPLNKDDYPIIKYGSSYISFSSKFFATTASADGYTVKTDAKDFTYVVVPKPGYVIKSFEIVGSTAGKVNVSTSGASKTLFTSPNATPKTSVKNYYSYIYSSASGKLELTVGHLICIENIVFYLEPKGFSNDDIILLPDSTIKDSNIACVKSYSVGDTQYNNVSGSGVSASAYFNTDNPYGLNYVYGKIMTINIVISEGYSVNLSDFTVNKIVMYSNRTTGTLSKDGTTTLKAVDYFNFEVKNGSNSSEIIVTMSSKKFHTDIKKIDIKVPITRNSATVTFEVNNVDVDKLTGDALKLIVTDPDGNSSTVTGGSSTKEISKGVTTYCLFNFTLTLQNHYSCITIDDIIIEGKSYRSKQLSADVIKTYLGLDKVPTSPDSTEKIFNLESERLKILTNGTTIKFVLSAKPDEMKVNVYKKLSTESTKINMNFNGTSSNSKTISYGTKFSVVPSTTKVEYDLKFNDINYGTISIATGSGNFSTLYSLDAGAIKQINVYVNGVIEATLTLASNGKLSVSGLNGDLILDGTYFKDGVTSMDVIVEYVVRDVNLLTYNAYVNSSYKINTNGIKNSVKQSNVSVTQKYTNEASRYSGITTEAGYEFAYYLVRYDNNVLADGTDISDISQNLTFTSLSIDKTLTELFTDGFKDNLTIITVYKAITYDLKFVTNQFNDEVNGNLILSKSESIVKWEYDTSEANLLTLIPTVTIPSGRMYEFTGWLSTQFNGGDLYLKYNSSNSSFSKDKGKFELANNSDESLNKTIIFNDQITTKSTTIKFVNLEGQVKYNGTVVYGSNEYYFVVGQNKTLVQRGINEISNPGYNQNGWKCTSNGQKYIDFDGNNTNWNIEATEVTFEPTYTSIVCSVKLLPGDYLKYSSSVSSYTLSVAYNTNLYGITSQENNAYSDNLISNSNNNKLTYKFAGYYRAVVSGTTYYIYVKNGACDESRSSTFDLNIYKYWSGSINNKKPIEFVACEELDSVQLSFEITDDTYNWVYDAKIHQVSIEEINNLSYSCVWKRNNVIVSTNKSLSVKNVVDSGTYTCDVTVTYTGTDASSIVLVSGLSVTVTITPHVLKFATQNDTEVTTLSRVYDGGKETYYIDENGFKQQYKVIGQLPQEPNASLTAKYTSANVGDNISLDISFANGTDSNNYKWQDELNGEITPYVVVYKVYGSTYRIPDDDPDKQIKLTLGKDYDLNDTPVSTTGINVRNSKAYLQSVLNLSVDIVIKTNRNEQGSYKQDNLNNTLVVESFKTNPQSSVINNLTYILEGEFTIKPLDNNTLLVNLKVDCEDARVNGTSLDDNDGAEWLTIANLVYTKVIGDSVVAVKSNREVNFTDIKNNLLGKEVEFSVNILNTNYRISGVKVNNVLTNSILNGQTVKYTIKQSDVDAGSLKIAVIITTLNTITFDYDIKSGESISGEDGETLTQTTKFASGITIQDSIDVYGAILPKVLRNGFKFVDWYYGSIKVNKNSVWTYGEGITLKARYSMDDLVITQSFDGVEQSTIKDSYEVSYDNQSHTISYIITNSNNITINYSYKWTNLGTNKVLTNTTNTLSVKDFVDSGKYKLDITATSDYGSKSASYTIDVKVNKINLFENNLLVEKIYDKTSATPDINVIGVDGNFVIKGQYLSSKAGSLINTNKDVWTINGVKVANYTNYNFNVGDLDPNSKINKRPVTLSIGDLQKEYDGNVFEHKGSFDDSVVSFTYSIKSISADVKIYSQDDNSIEISITGDDIANFNITINGSLTIKKANVTNIVFEGNKNIIFDGQYHSLTPVLPSYIVGSKIIYITNSGSQEYDFNNNIGVKDADSYSVTFTVQSSANYEVDTSAYATLTISKRTIYIEYGNEISYEKEYDGTLDVDASQVSANIWAELGSTTLDFIPVEERPIIRYNFDNPNACQTDSEIKLIYAYLQDSTNYEISNLYKTLCGKIYKIQTNLYVKTMVQKIYDNEGFTVTSENLTLVNRLSTQNLTGSIVFAQIKNVGEYADLASQNINISNLYVGEYLATTNYDITFVNNANGLLKIIPTRIEVTNTAKDNGSIKYIYTGKEVAIEYTIVNADLISVLPDLSNFVITYSTPQTPINVGEYTYTLTLTGEGSANFALIGDYNEVPFEIVVRKILISFEKHFLYSNSHAVYSSDVYTDDYILNTSIEGYYPICEGETFSWIFETNSSDEGSYVVTTTAGEYGVQRTITIKKGNVDTKDNYKIEYATGTAIVIDRITINSANDIKIFVFDQSEEISLTNKQLFESGSGVVSKVYDGKTKQLVVIIRLPNREVTSDIDYEKFVYGSGNYFTDFVMTNSIVEGTQQVSSVGIKYQGNYNFKLNLKNFVINYSKDLQFEITSKQVSTTFDSTKVYDANTNVNNVEIIGLCENDGDYIYAIGEYASKNVGENIVISIRLSTKSTADTTTAMFVLSSYRLQEVTNSGSITKANLTMYLQAAYITYFDGNYVEISVALFTMSTVNNEIITGTILVKKSQVGNYKLNELSANDIVFSLDSNANNYSYNYQSFVEGGQLIILPAELVVNVADAVKIYNATKQPATVTVDVYEDVNGKHGDIVDSEVFEVEYYTSKQNNATKVEPINAGTYYIKVKVANNNPNYKIMDTNFENGFYTTELIIQKRDIKVKVDSYFASYTSDPIEYNVTNNDIIDPTSGNNGGLVKGHILNIVLSTNSGKAGKYQISDAQVNIGDNTKKVYPKSITITENGTEVKDNYSIVYDVTIFIVARAVTIDSSNITNIVYTSTDVTQLNEFVVIFNYENADYTITYNNSVELSNGYVATLNGLKLANGTSVSQAVDIGTYNISLNLLNVEDSNLDIDPQTIVFDIIPKAIKNISYTQEKYYDTTSNIIGEITSSDIFDVDKTNVVISGNYVSDGQPSASVGSYKVEFALSGSRSFNYYLDVGQKNGVITKQPVKLVLKTAKSTYYTGNSYDGILISDFNVYKNDTNQQIQNFNITGNIVVKEINSGSYTLHNLYSNSKILENINDINKLLDNYQIVDYVGDFTIQKCEIEANVNTSSVIYNAKSQPVTYSYNAKNGFGSILDSENADLIVVKYNENENAPVNVGTYAVTLEINSKYSNNYNLAVKNYGNYVIDQREISVQINPIYKAVYTQQKAQYIVPNNNVTNLLTEVGHNFVGILQTNDSVIQVYNAPTEISWLDGWDVLEGETSVKSNYNLTGYTGQIEIAAIEVGKIDQEHLDSLVYNTKDFMTTGDIYVVANYDFSGTSKTIKFVLNEDNEEGSLTTNHIEIKNAGTYTVYLTIENTDVQNEPIVFDVKKKEISTLSSIQLDKIYDGDAIVSKDQSIESNDIYSIDKSNVVLSAKYVDVNDIEIASKGEHNIRFTMSGSQTSNYDLKLEGYTGVISAKEIIITLKPNYSSYYYTGNNIVLNSNAFTATGVLNETLDEYLVGEVTISLLNSGVYDLQENSSNVNFNNIEINSDDYQISGVAGTLTIDRANLIVTISELSKVYNGSGQKPSFNVDIYSNYGAGDVNESYISVVYRNVNGDTFTRPVDVGEYFVDITIEENVKSNYTLVSNISPFEIDDSYTYSEKFEITKKDIEIVVSTKTFDYTGSNLEYQLVNDDILTLVSGHTVQGKLTTNGYKGGVYKLDNVAFDQDFSVLDITPSVIIKAGNENVTQNYNITTITAEIKVVSKIADEFDISYINNTLIYDKTNKITENKDSTQIKVKLNIDGTDYTFFVLKDQGTLVIENNYDNNLGNCESTISNFKYNSNTIPLTAAEVVTVGDYSFDITVVANESNITKTIEFNVLPIVITKVDNRNITKVYDGTTIVNEIITSDDFIIDGDNVEFVVEYTDANVGTHEINVSLNGIDAFNYILENNFVLYGEITLRNISLSLKQGVEFTFDNKNPVISNEQLEIGGQLLANGEVLDGTITLNKKDADIYDFTPLNLDLSNLSIKNAENISTLSNYSISYTGYIIIVAKQVEVNVPEIDLTYNGQIRDVDFKNYLVADFDDKLSNLSSLAQDALTISYNVTPLNAGEYTATISSSSANFVFSIYGSELNYVTFEIKKRDIQIDIGDLEVYYNPTSDFETLLKVEDIKNIVEEQVVQGVYRVNKVGANVGTYYFDNSETKLIVEEFKIIVNGQDILSINYNLNSEILGSLKIKLVYLDESKVWLDNDTFMYTGNDVINITKVMFIDANGVTQFITKTNQTLGQFTLVDVSEAINVGNYAINVEIFNYTLENSTLTFSIYPREIRTKKIIYQSDKNYDGNARIYNEYHISNLDSIDLFDDGLVINGYYVDGNNEKTIDIGVHNIAFELVAKNQEAEQKLNNYVFTGEVSGQIFAIDATLTINHTFIYNQTGEYTLDITSEMISGLLQNIDSVSGFIKLTKPDYIGNISKEDISLESVIIKNTNNTVVTQNYNVIIQTNISIVKAQISIDFTGVLNSYTYKAEPIEVDAKSIVVIEDENADLTNIVKKSYVNTANGYVFDSTPLNVGSYKIIYSIESDFYEFDSENEFEYQITEYIYQLVKNNLDVDAFSKYYGEQDPDLKFTFETPLNENIIVIFQRVSGEVPGKYDVSVKSWDNNNYQISLSSEDGKDLFVIKQAGLKIIIVDSSTNVQLLQKVYDNSAIADVDIQGLEYEAYNIRTQEEVSDRTTIGTLAYGTAENTQVGYYALVSWDLTNEYYDEFEVISEIMFNITPKQVQVVAENANKIYDASTKFLGTLKLVDQNNNVLGDNYPLTVSGVYSSADVNTDIEIILTYENDNLDNYILLDEIYGDITKREIVVTPVSDQFVVYGNTEYSIVFEITDNNASEFYGDIQSEISGELYIQLKQEQTKFIVGEYPIQSDLLSDNLDILFTENIIFEIVQKELTVTSSGEISKVYDGTTQVEQSFELQGIEIGDYVTIIANYEDAKVGTNKIVQFTLQGIDANNYFVQNTIGDITEKIVLLNYIYEQTDMINPELITNNALESSQLIYGQKVEYSIGTMPVPMHEGYEFAGWFLDSTFTIQIDENTLVDESIWNVNVEERFAYAKWTIKKFNLHIVVLTRIGVIYEESSIGGSISNIDGLYDYYSYVQLNDLDVANNGYKFIGYASQVELLPDEDYLTNGIQIMPKDNILYAKFDPLLVKVILNSNNGVFERSGEWTYNEFNTTASLNVEYNGAINAILPVALKEGYTQVYTDWTDENEVVYQISELTVISSIWEYAEELNLYAVYEANSYKLILNAAGGYFDDISNDWIVEQEDLTSRPIVISKEVKFNDAVGEILIPKRAGYTFDTWSQDDLDEDYVWTYVGEHTFEALWIEDSHILTITTEHGNVEVKVYNAFDVLLENTLVVSGSVSKEITVKTTNKVTMEVVADQGYLFDSWTSTFDEANNSEEIILSTANYYDDYSFVVNYKPKQNTITIKSNNDIRGYVQSGDNTTSGTGVTSVVAYTEEVVEISATPREGYIIAGWLIESDYDCILSGNETDAVRILSGFIDDVTVTVVFDPQDNNITIVTDAEKGILFIDDTVRTESYTHIIKTEDTLEFTIVAKHGYKVDLTPASWNFNTSSSNKGQFEFEGDGYNAIIKFSGFTYDGQIVVPFIKDTFRITVVSVVKDIEYTLQPEQSIVTLNQNDSINNLDSGDTFVGLYQSVVTLKANEVITGYSFSNWSLESDKVRLILESDGFVKYNDDGSMDFAILDTITIYVVYEINTYKVSFKVNDEIRGNLTYNGHQGLKSYEFLVKFGYDAPEIIAETEDYYEFVKWVKIEDETQIFVTEENRFIATNIQGDCEYLAIFAGKPIEFILKLELSRQDIFKPGEIDFADIVFTGNEKTQLTSKIRDNNIITYTISTYTGEDISLAILEKVGYEYSSLSVDPRIIYEMNNLQLDISRLNVATEMVIEIKAQIHTVVFKITGQTIGANVFPKPNSNGIVSVESPDGNKTLILGVKTGGDAYSILYTYFGYKLLNNTIFTEEQVIDNVYGEENSKSYNGGIENIVQDEEINIEVAALKYHVTFILGDEDNTTFEADIYHGQTDFIPRLTQEIQEPTRYKYVFQGYNTREDYNGISYNFNRYGIYTTQYDENGAANQVNGFRGSFDAVASTREGIDYDCNLYAEWELEKHEVKIVYVPNFAINQESIVYTEIFPNTIGRHRIMRDNEIVGIAYEPDSIVTINSPRTLVGFNYYGWSYNANITDRTQLQAGIYNDVMGREEIVVYLYYLIEVNAVAQEGGSATISDTSVLYNGTTTIEASADAGYDFGYWLQNATKLNESHISMQVVITSPVTYYAVFIGKTLEVILDTNEHGKLRISQSTSAEVYRVGDVILLEFYDIDYGYSKTNWLGEYSGTIASNGNYKILADDQSRGYVRFGIKTEPKTVSIQFVVEDRTGGTFVFNGDELVNTTKEFKYDETFEFGINTQDRFEFVTLTLNDVEMSSTATRIAITQSNGFSVDKINVLSVTFRQKLWIEVYEMFTGQGTQDDPYIIQNERQLAAMAYLINGEIESQGTIPYAQGYYVVKRNMNLAERFWQPIGTRENPFDGTFEIADYRVDELLLDKAYSVTHLNGLFGYITENAQFITKAKNYTTAIVIISTVVGAVIAGAATIIIVIVSKRKRMKKFSTKTSISTDNLKRIQDDD